MVFSGFHSNSPTGFRLPFPFLPPFFFDSNQWSSYDGVPSGMFFSETAPTPKPVSPSRSSFPLFPCDNKLIDQALFGFLELITSLAFFASGF